MWWLTYFQNLYLYKFLSKSVLCEVMGFAALRHTVFFIS